MRQPHIVQLGKQRNKGADENSGIGKTDGPLLLQIFLQRDHMQVFRHAVQRIVFRKEQQCFEQRLVVDLHQPLPTVVQIRRHGAEQRFAFRRDQDDAFFILAPSEDPGEEFLDPDFALLFGIPGQIGR